MCQSISSSFLAKMVGVGKGYNCGLTATSNVEFLAEVIQLMTLKENMPLWMCLMSVL